MEQLVCPACEAKQGERHLEDPQEDVHRTGSFAVHALAARFDTELWQAA
jgi:hypothetical protein